MNIGKRIKEIRTQLLNDMSRKDFSAKLGIVENTVRNYELEASLPNSDVISKICNTFNIDPVWLLDGVGSMTKGDLVLPQNDDLIMIPMVEAVLSAGGGSFETNSTKEREYAFRKDFICRKGNPNDMVLMRVSGDSMEPDIQNNDVVLIDQSKTTILASKIYAVAFDDCVYIKRVEKDLNGIILISSNSNYSPIQITMNEQTENQFKIIGRVLWCGREFL
ncbi:XRE family transcriptional regulator [Helicobacter japonicus]|uniref:XRE family transcriptional regulator n=1 Tax=Helicobacter japonicus TaxID=425400 RepID=UPI00321F69CE